MKNVSNKSCRENQNTLSMFNNFFFGNFTVYEIFWKNIVKPYMPRVTIWRMRIACWITESKNTHSECVKFMAFPLQQSLNEHHSVLRYNYTTCVARFIHSLFYSCVRKDHKTYSTSTFVRYLCVGAALVQTYE